MAGLVGLMHAPGRTTGCCWNLALACIGDVLSILLMAPATDGACQLVSPACLPACPPAHLPACPPAGDICFVAVPDELLLLDRAKVGGAGVKSEERAAIALRRLLLSHSKEQASGSRRRRSRSTSAAATTAVAVLLWALLAPPGCACPTRRMPIPRLGASLPHCFVS